MLEPSQKHSILIRSLAVALVAAMIITMPGMTGLSYALDKYTAPTALNIQPTSQNNANYQNTLNICAFSFKQSLYISPS